MRRRSEVAGMSAAAVDLLSCGLAAAAVLWLLLLPNSGAEGIGTEKTVNGSIVVGQFGEAHIFHRHALEPDVIIDFNDGMPAATLEVVNSGRPTLSSSGGGAGTTHSFHSPVTIDGKVPKIAINTRGVDAHFAGELAINFENVKPGSKVSFNMWICKDPSKPHPLRTTIATRQGVKSHIYVAQHADFINDALQVSAPSKGFAAWLRANPNYASDQYGLMRPYIWANENQAAVRVTLTASATGAVKVSFGGDNDDRKLDRSFIHKIGCWARNEPQGTCA